MNILLSIRSRHEDDIYAGRKSIELRKTYPKRYVIGALFKAYMYSSGKDGKHAITGYFFSEYGLYDSYGFYNIATAGEICQKACVSKNELRDYLPAFGWKVFSCCRFINPVPLSAIGLNRPPQSWQYLTDEQFEIIERLGKGKQQ